jgi:hypothetical protein
MAKLNSGTRIYGNLTVDTNVTVGAQSILMGTATTTSIGTAAATIDSFASATYRSAKYLISVIDVTNTQYQTSEIGLVQDGTNATIVTYGTVYSGASSRMTFSANIVSNNVTLYGTGISVSNTVKLIRTLIPV